MTTDLDKMANDVMLLTAADRSFFEMVDNTLARIRQILGAPGAPQTERAEPVTEQDLERLRERMAAFLPQYEEIYRRLLVKHIGDEQLATCVESLRTGPVRRYFDATLEMRGELAEELQQLGARMIMLTLG